MGFKSSAVLGPTYKEEILKIDSAATDGLLGTPDSLAYEVSEIEHHIHNWERWFETAAVPNGEIHVADRIGEGAGSFQADAGNDDWGDWVQILGSADTPADAGMVYYDFHYIIVEDTERAATYFVQIGLGESGAAALAAGTYTEFVYSATVQKETGIISIICHRVAVGTKAWLRVNCPGQATGTWNCFCGVHEYPG